MFNYTHEGVIPQLSIKFETIYHQIKIIVKLYFTCLLLLLSNLNWSLSTNHSIFHYYLNNEIQIQQKYVVLDEYISKKNMNLVMQSINNLIYLPKGRLSLCPYITYFL